MNLADMLSYADIGQLARIAQRYGCVCNERSKHELIQSILLALGSRDVFERHVKEMSLEERRFLNSILFDKRSSFSLEELVARVQQTKFDTVVPGKSDPGPSGHQPRDTIAKFKHSGWLFNGCNPQTKYLFQIPADLKQRFKDVLYQSFSSQLQLTAEPHAYRDEDGRVGDDILQLLDFVATESPPLNSEGVMYKRAQQQLLDTFAIRETPIGKGEWRFGYGRRFHDYPNRLSFIYDYAFYQGWLEEGDGRLRCSPPGEERRSRRGTEPTASLYRFWLKLYKNAVPNLLSVVHWIQLCTSRWTTLESLERTLLPYIRPFYFDTSESVFRQRIIMMMVHLGLLRLGETANEAQVLQMTKKGQQIIQGVYVAHEDRIQLNVDKPHAH